MAWSYKTNRSDEVNASGDGPVKVPSTPTTYAVDGAIDPDCGLALLTKGSAGAYTLAAPTRQGQELLVQAGSAFAHVVTATGLIQDGVTGGAKNTYTTAAFVGSGATFRGINGTWYLMAKNLGATA